MRRNLSRLRHGKLVTVIAIGFGALIFVQLSGYQRWMKLFDAWDREAELRQQVETLEKENKEIEETIRQLAPGGPEVERIAREKIGLARPDERVVVLPGKK